MHMSYGGHKLCMVEGRESWCGREEPTTEGHSIGGGP